MTLPKSPARRSFFRYGAQSICTAVVGRYGLLGLTACQAANTPDNTEFFESGRRSDNEAVQSALNRGGTIYLDRTYVITSTIYISGDTQIIGTSGAKIVWKGPPDQSIIRDTSTIEPRRVNRNILIENLEIDGGSLTTGSAEQLAIDFYRTGDVILRNLTVHGVGGSGIRWGNSYLDTTEIVVEGCTIYDCRVGDALQGSGRRISLRNNVIGKQGSASSFGDTGIALLKDFSSTTNPEGLFSNDVIISSNIISGNYKGKVFTGVGGKSQTGIAIGPFDTNTKARIVISKNDVSGCYVNVWLSVMVDVNISNNVFHSHASTMTGNVRLDSVSDLKISENRFYIDGIRSGGDFSAILLQAMRSTFGLSTFDGDVTNFTIINNSINAANPADGIKINFGSSNINPVYIAKVANGIISENSFIGPLSPIVLSPVTGETPLSLRDVTILKNTAKGSATALVTLSGRKSQYTNVHIDANILSGKMEPLKGTGSQIE